MAELRGEVMELTCEVLLSDVEVVVALPVGEPLVQLARLGIDEIRGERAGIAAEERVRERAVSPEEAGEMQADEQLRECSRDRRLRCRQHAATEDQAVRKRELEKPRHEHGGQLVAVLRAPAVNDADRLDRRRLLALKRREQPVLTCRQPRRELLQCEQAPAELDEADDVAADAPLDLDEVALGPVLER